MKDPNWRKCVLRADSRDIIKRIPDDSIDFILTDPPYNLGQHSTGNIPLPGRTAMNNDVADWDMIDFNPEEWADEFIRILKPTGNLFIFTSYNQLGRWYNSLDHKFDTSNFMIWHKTNPAPKIFKAGFLNSCEMIFTCWNKKHTWNFISQAEMHNFIESSICMKPERLSNPKHPAQKPVSILKKMIEIASNENDIVFDPFMGVGSTGVAALELNRRFIGVELDEAYFDAAQKRVKASLTQGDLFAQSNIENQQRVEEETFMASEPLEIHASPIRELNLFFGLEDKEQSKLKVYYNIESGLSPIIKWPGGKEKELKYIIPNAPQFERFIEPFVGGGSVFMGIESWKYLINDFSSGRTNVLIGTQMVTKGLDFGRVTVVGILDADTMLNFPDFRAYEQAFMMMAQVSGRAGRRGKQGHVFLQTRSADLPVIHQVIAHDYQGFYRDVIRERIDFHYPPFYHLVFVYLKHRNSDVVELAAQELGNRLRQGFGSRVLGPDKPSVARVKNLAIRKIIVKLENGANLPRCKQYMKDVYRLLMQDKRYASLQVYYDVDPL